MSLCCYTVLVFFLLIIVIIITVYPIALLILALNNDRIKLRYYIMTDFTEINMSCAPGGAARDYKALRCLAIHREVGTKQPEGVVRREILKKKDNMRRDTGRLCREALCFKLLLIHKTWNISVTRGVKVC